MCVGSVLHTHKTKKRFDTETHAHSLHPTQPPTNTSVILLAFGMRHTTHVAALFDTWKLQTPADKDLVEYCPFFPIPSSSSPDILRGQPVSLTSTHSHSHTTQAHKTHLGGRKLHEGLVHVVRGRQGATVRLAELFFVNI